MVGLQQRYKELRKLSVPRHVHEKVLKEVSEQNKQLQQDVGSLSLQTEARDAEKERWEEKVLALQKEVNRLCMLSARKDVSMEHNKLAADVALHELRLDKEASDTYHQQVLQLLQQDVEKGINTEEDLQQEIQAMKAQHKNSKQAQAHSCGGLHRQHGWCGPQRSDDIVHAHAPQDHHAVEKTGLPLPDPHHQTGPVSVPEAEKSATEETGDVENFAISVCYDLARLSTEWSCHWPERSSSPCW